MKSQHVLSPQRDELCVIQNANGKHAGAVRECVCSVIFVCLHAKAYDWLNKHTCERRISLDEVDASVSKSCGCGYCHLCFINSSILILDMQPKPDKDQ